MKKTISELIREELVRILWEADGPTDPTGDEDFDNGSEASKQAKQLGLVHKAYGYYMDPKTGEVVARSIKGHLVKTEKGEEPVGQDTGKPDDTTPTTEPGASVDTSKTATQSTNDVNANVVLKKVGGDVEKAKELIKQKLQKIESDPLIQQYGTQITGFSGKEPPMGFSDKQVTAARTKWRKMANDHKFLTGALQSLDAMGKTAQPQAAEVPKAVEPVASAPTPEPTTEDPAAEKQKIEKILSSIDLILKNMVAKSGKGVLKTKKYAEYVGLRDKYTTKLAAFDNNGAAGDASTTPPQAPGSGNPPMHPDQTPWEVKSKTSGKSGYIDYIDPKTAEAHVTFHDGSFAWVNTDDIDPVGDWHQKALVAQGLKQMANDPAIAKSSGDVDHPESIYRPEWQPSPAMLKTAATLLKHFGSIETARHAIDKARWDPQYKGKRKELYGLARTLNAVAEKAKEKQAPQTTEPYTGPKKNDPEYTKQRVMAMSPADRKKRADVLSKMGQPEFPEEKPKEEPQASTPPESVGDKADAYIKKALEKRAADRAAGIPLPKPEPIKEPSPDEIIIARNADADAWIEKAAGNIHQALKYVKERWNEHDKDYIKISSSPSLAKKVPGKLSYAYKEMQRYHDIAQILKQRLENPERPKDDEPSGPENPDFNDYKHNAPDE